MLLLAAAAAVAVAAAASAAAAAVAVAAAAASAAAGLASNHLKMRSAAGGGDYSGFGDGNPWELPGSPGSP